MITCVCSISHVIYHELMLINVNNDYDDQMRSIMLTELVDSILFNIFL